MALFSRSKEPMTASDLCDITRGLQEAASATHNLIAQQYIKLFDQFFDYDIEELGTPMKAKMVEVALDDQHNMRIPLIALVAPRGLSLDTMKVDLSVRIQNTELVKANHALENGEVQSERFYVTVGADKRQSNERDPDEVQISLQFKACDPPEAINRLLEEYTQLISPYRQASLAVATPPPDEPNEFIQAATVL